MSIRGKNVICMVMMFTVSSVRTYGIVIPEDHGELESKVLGWYNFSTAPVDCSDEILWSLVFADLLPPPVPCLLSPAFVMMMLPPKFFQRRKISFVDGRLGVVNIGGIASSFEED